MLFEVIILMCTSENKGFKKLEAPMLSGVTQLTFTLCVALIIGHVVHSTGVQKGRSACRGGW